MRVRRKWVGMLFCIVEARTGLQSNWYYRVPFYDFTSSVSIIKLQKSHIRYFKDFLYYFILYLSSILANLIVLNITCRISIYYLRLQTVHIFLKSHLKLFCSIFKQYVLYDLKFTNSNLLWNEWYKNNASI